MNRDRRLLLRARLATLLDHFKLTPEQVGRLTDRQIGQLYFHARDEQTGAIRAPDAPLAPGQQYRREVAALDGLLGAHLISRENHAGCVAKLKAKYGIGEEEGTADG